MPPPTCRLAATSSYPPVGTPISRRHRSRPNPNACVAVVEAAGCIASGTCDNLAGAVGSIGETAAAKAAGQLEKLANPATGTVWEIIIATAGDIPGTRIPATFEAKAGGQAFWVNSNATEHFGEYITRLGASGSPISSQEMLRSFQSAIDDIAKSGTPALGQVYNAGGWEIVFQKSSSDKLPVIVHAFPQQLRNN